jgi:hypothetical protein
VLRVEIDGKPVTEIGPEAIVREMALLREGRRMATLRAVIPLPDRGRSQGLHRPPGTGAGRQGPHTQPER